MLWVLGLTSCVYILFFAMAMVGLFLLRASSLINFRKVTLEHISLSVLVGSAVLVLVLGYLSYLGMTMHAESVLMLFVFALLFIFLIISVAKKKIVFSQCVLWVVPFIFILCLVGFLNITLYNAFNPYGDAFTYTSIADYLRNHAFSFPVPRDNYQPIFTQSYLYQSAGLRMGANFFLGFVTCIFHIQRSVTVFPGVCVFEISLIFSAIYFFLREVWKVPRFYVAIGFLFGLGCYNVLYYSANSAFAPQLFGLAFFTAAISMLSLLVDPQEKIRYASLFILFSLFSAALISAYSEMSPVLLGIFFLNTVYLLVIKRAPFLKTSEVFFGCCALTIVFSGKEFLRSLHALPSQMHAVVGGNIPFKFPQFSAVVFGLYPGFYPLNAWKGSTCFFWVALLLCFIVFLLGIKYLFKNKEKNVVLLIGMGFFILMAIHFASVAFRRHKY